MREKEGMTHTLISIGGWCRHMHHTRSIRHNFCLTNSHSSYLHPSQTICDSPSHQIFTVGPIKHSLRSTATFICPPPSSLQLVHHKPPQKPENMRTLCLRVEQRGDLVYQRRRGAGDGVKLARKGDLD